jgi:hypothetical protein
MVATRGKGRLPLTLYQNAWRVEVPNDGVCVDAIKTYITENLLPYEIMWVNWRRLTVYGFDLHWRHSMKSGLNGV